VIGVMSDLACSFCLLAALVGGAAAYVRRRSLAGPGQARSGAEWSERVTREGRSVFLGRGPMQAFYSLIERAGRACVALGWSANGISWASLALGVGAGPALATGHFGIGAGLAALSATGDALDGWVARRTGTASDGGEILDATVDRYTESAFLAGLAVYFRASVILLALTLAALVASFMMSYGTAKAEAVRIDAPRGSMRRAERAAYLIGGAALTPLAEAAFPSSAWATAPIVLALLLVALVGNVSAIQRLAFVAGAAAKSRPAPKPLPRAAWRDETHA
jgi:CDP-diacylglycerol--glycerol-3-phosphate 3-phosphatidyltransferase